MIRKRALARMKPAEFAQALRDQATKDSVSVGLAVWLHEAARRIEGVQPAKRERVRASQVRPRRSRTRPKQWHENLLENGL